MMERKNFIKEVQTEKMRTKQRLAELLNDLADAKTELEENRAIYDKELLCGGKSGDEALSKFQKSMLKTEGLQRIVSDIELRVLPSFSEREAEARDRGSKAFFHEFQPIHAETKKEIENILLMMATTVEKYISNANEAIREWGGNGHYELFNFTDLKMTGALWNAVDFKHRKIQEAYRPAPNYQPILGGGSGFRPTDEKSSYV